MSTTDYPSLESTLLTGGARMGSSQDFVEFVVDQIDADCAVTYKKMFGEFGLYSHGKLFALICDDQLFVKRTEGGKAHIGDVVEAPPYPGAKPIFLIGSGIDDSEWLSELVRITARELPEPKPKSRRKSKSKPKPKQTSKSKPNPKAKSGSKPRSKPRSKKGRTS